jgi:hypothetical protein
LKTSSRMLAKSSKRETVSRKTREKFELLCVRSCFRIPRRGKRGSDREVAEILSPGIGVTSLMAAAEVKFVTTKEEARAVLDGIYADMKGYSGRDDWRSFYAVIYMTEPFYSQKDVEREFRLVKAELSWTPFVVLGAGARKKKAAK